MVLYFTATGNSLYVAKMLDDERLSIPQVIQNEKMEFSADRIGIVCPVYGHEMPDLVKLFLKQASFHTNYFYLVLTYGRIHGGAAELADNYLKTCGLNADYINTIMMVDNYLPSFDMNEQIAINPEKKVEAHIAEIKKDIDAKKRWKQSVTKADRDWHKKYLEMRNANPIGNDEIFQMKQNCVGCGVCTRVCPTGRIQIENQHAVYHSMEQCQMCLACVHHCPKNAIGLTIPEKNPNARYHNENIRLSEIVEANNQNKYQSKGEIE